ncbi:MAG: TIM barrel protein [Ardenticatenaceae bacterium]|nr:TIM barrel protein [Ardenticatenaceae bacterium]MCB9443446.1 TIM barrel protein [Ardenticatenaceae bacterium]
MTNKHSIKRGVSFYSFQEEYFLRQMSLEDIIATTAKLGIPGVEIIPDQMIRGYPNIPDSFVKQWHGWMEKYERTPVCIDMFLDWNKYDGRIMTTEERVESIKMDIINANKLGCSVIRVIHDAEPEILEGLAPIAEKYNVKLALEIHAPSFYDSPLEQRLIEMFDHVQSPYLCFTLDLGVFCKKLPRVASERFLREGMKPEIVEYLVDGYNNGTLPKSNELSRRDAGLADKIMEMGGRKEDVYWAYMGTHMIYAEPRKMLPYLKYTSHIHGKFYEMVDDQTEFSIPYDEIIPILIEGGYEGYIDSEYEGNRWIQDAFDVDSTEQVRRHQAMLKSLLGEE